MKGWKWRILRDCMSKQNILNTEKKRKESYWEKQAAYFVWTKPWKKIFSGNFDKGDSRWFVGAKLNITENCLDRNLKSGADNTAIIWEPNNPSGKGISLTYKELHEQVCKMANVLNKYKVKKGDFVCLYMPMIPQVVISMLACARVGAVHNVVFTGFSAQSLADRINDSGCKLLITSDIGYRGEKEINFSQEISEVIKLCPTLQNTLIYSRLGGSANSVIGGISLNDELEKASIINTPKIINSEDPLFVLYTSGSTGKPKGIIHSAGAYMVYAYYSFMKVFNYKPGEIFWCTADVGWITGHTYGVYGPLLAHGTIVLFEGIPTYPSPSRYWEIIEKLKVNIFYTAPTVIRSLESFGLSYVNNFKLKSLRLIGSVGEPLNVEAWNWYYHNVGKDKCSVVDTWWQTETGGILISPQETFKAIPGSVGLPLPGIEVALLNEKGEEITNTKDFGYLCLKAPWPGLAKEILNDKKRFFETYLSKFKGYYFSGDMARRDEAGYYYISGRIDDVIKVSGHRLGSAEIENAIDLHPDVVESVVVGYPHPIKGYDLYAFIIMGNKRNDIEELEKEIIEMVIKKIGSIARLGKIQIVKNLPKTRSGKIVRRILRKLVSGGSCEDEDTTTLIDPHVIEDIRKGII